VKRKLGWKMKSKVGIVDTNTNRLEPIYTGVPRYLRELNLVVIGYLHQLRSDKYKLDHDIITAYLDGSPIGGGIYQTKLMFSSPI
jgi:hypothetical protein